MSARRSFEKICAAAIIVALLASILLWGYIGANGGQTSQKIGYEDRLFDTSYVHSIDIVADNWDSFISNCENEEYINCSVVIDGENMKNVAIRAKGNTSLSSVSAMGSQRYSFKIEFDHNQKGKTYHGLDKLCLNNLIQDNSMLKDFLAYQMMADFGVDAPLCSFVYVRVNGNDWGLYLAVEAVEESFIARNYVTSEGDLYKPDSLSFGGGRGNGQGFDFENFRVNEDDTTGTQPDESQQTPGSAPSSGGPSGQQTPSDGFAASFGGSSGVPSGNRPTFPGTSDGNFSFPGGGEQPDASGGAPGIGFGGFSFGGSSDVKLQYIDDDPDSYSNIFNNAKTKVTEADQQRLIQALRNLSSNTDIENTVDTDEVMRYFVVHNYLRNGDSYTGSMIHNYYLYEKNGQLSMIPWDYNLAYGTFTANDASGEVNASIDSPVMNGNVSDRPMLAWIFSSEEYTEKYHELYREFIDTWFSDGKLEQWISELYTMLRPYVEKDPTRFCTVEEFDTAVTAITRFCTLRGESIQNQLDGKTEKVDTGDLNLADMGAMNTGGGNEMPGAGGFGGGMMPGNMTLPEGMTVPDAATQATQAPQPSADNNMTAPGGMSFPDGMNPGAGTQPAQMPQTAGGSNMTPPDGMSFPEGMNPGTGTQSAQMPQTAGGSNMTPPDGMSFPQGMSPSAGTQSVQEGSPNVSQLPQVPAAAETTNAEQPTVPAAEADTTPAQTAAPAVSGEGNAPARSTDRQPSTPAASDSSLVYFWISIAVLVGGLVFAFVFHRRKK